jgi:uncharacterized protein YlxW (UPF0749 family)
MIWWVFGLGVLAILSYLSDVGILSSLQDLRIPFFNASIISVLILLCLAGLLGRMLQMAKKGEKESFRRRILELEQELKTLQEKEK